MLNSTVLDVAIGLTFMYLVLGLMCTTVNEWIAQLLEMRAVTLKQGIHTLLNAQTSGDCRFAMGSLNIPGLLDRLNTPGDKLGGLLDLKSAATLEHGDTMVSRLNELLGKPDLLTRIDTSSVSAATLSNARKQSSAAAGSSEVVRANYALLTEAYPNEIGGLLHRFYNHTLIQALARRGKHPAYILPRTFATALIDILAGGTLEEISFEKLIAAIAGLPDNGVKRSLVVLARDAKGDVDRFRLGLEQWYDETMDHVSGWYKKKTQVITAIVAACITIFANADTVHVSRQLFVNPTVRQKIVSAAVERKGAAGDSVLTAEEKAEIGELTGWSAEFVTFNAMKAAQTGKGAAASEAFPGLDLVRSPRLFLQWMGAVLPAHILGWFLTAVAVSLGAPFWFDMLNKVMNVRSAGTSPNEKGKNLPKA